MKSPEDLFKLYLRRPGKRRLARVVSAYHGLVWQTAYRVTSNREDAEDICQDVFLKLPGPGTYILGFHSDEGQGSMDAELTVLPGADDVRRDFDLQAP